MADKPSPTAQLPDYYRLLGVTLFERNTEVIAKAVDQRTAHAESLLTGEQAAAAQRTLKAILAAKACLLDPEQKAAYDKQLRKKLIGGIDDLPPLTDAGELPPELPVTPTTPTAVGATATSAGPIPQPRRRSWTIPVLLVIIVMTGIGAAAYVWNRSHKELAQAPPSTLAPKSEEVKSVSAPSDKDAETKAPSVLPVEPAEDKATADDAARQRTAAAKVAEEKAAVGKAAEEAAEQRAAADKAFQEAKKRQVIAAAKAEEKAAVNKAAADNANKEPPPAKESSEPSASPKLASQPNTTAPGSYESPASKPPYPNDAVAFNGHHYKVFWGRMSWHDAASACEAKGGHLAIIGTPDKKEFLAKLKGHDKVVWVGASRQNGTWKWLDGTRMSQAVTDHSPLDYAAFTGGAGLNARKENGLRPDGKIKWIQGYICEWDR